MTVQKAHLFVLLTAVVSTSVQAAQGDDRLQHRLENLVEAVAGAQPSAEHPDTSGLPIRGSYLPYARAILAARSGDCQVATRELDQLQGSAWHPSALYSVSHCWRKAGQRATAEQLLTTGPLSTVARTRCTQLWYRARGLQQLGLHRQAAAPLREIWTLCPTSKLATQAQQILLTLAQEYRIPYRSKTDAELEEEAKQWRQAGGYWRAERILRGALTRTKAVDRRGEIQLTLSKLYIQLGRYRRAQHYLKKLTKDGLPEHAHQARLLSADVYSRRSGAPLAFAQLETAILQAPSSEAATAARWEHASLSAKLAHTWDARSMLSNILLTQDSQGQPSQHLLQAHWMNTWLTWRSGDWQASVFAIRGLMEQPSLDNRALYWLGRWHALVKDNVRATQYWRQVCDSNPLDYYCFAARSSGYQPDLPAEGPAVVDDLTFMVSENADIQSAQDLLRWGLYQEVTRWLRPLDYRALPAVDGIALAQLHHRLGEIFRANIIARQSVRDYVQQAFQVQMSQVAASTVQSPSARPTEALNWLHRHRPQLALAIAFPNPFASLVAQTAQQKEIPASLIASTIYQESAFNEKALSSRRARGLMQLIGRTARAMARLEKLRGFRTYQLFDAKTNVTLGSRYLSELWIRYRGEPALVAAAYHAGERTVDRWLKRRGHLPRDVFIEEIPYSSTQRYVKNALAVIAIYQQLYYPQDPQIPQLDRPFL